MKSVFVSEYLCGGAWAEEEIPDSLLREGRAMLLAVCEDLLKSGKFSVCTTRDQRVSLGHIEGLEIVDVDSPEQEWKTFQQLATQSDATLVIAPELDEILPQRIDWLEKNNRNHLMSSANATRICSDKLLFFNFCQQHQLPSPETFLWEQAAFATQSNFPCPFPFIVKPQFGAGTTMTAKISSQNDWHLFSEQRKNEDDFPPYIMQPFLTGVPVSVACIVSEQQDRVEWLPLGQQHFNTLEYLGGTIPFQHPLSSQIQEIAEKVVSCLPGLRGYLGFDFLLIPEAKSPVQLLEINSRLTTSYLGYHALAKDSIAKRMLESHWETSLEWSQKTVYFDVTGNLNFKK